MGYKINPWANSLPQQVQINKENIEWLRKYLPNYKGEWNINTPYNYNDVILYNDATYVFKNKDIKDVKGIIPTDTNYWQIVGRIGKDGETLPFASNQNVKDTWLKGDTSTQNTLIRESEAKVIDDRLTQINNDLTTKINTKFTTADFFKTLVANLKAGNNITFDVDETAQTITINSTGGGGGAFTCDDLNSCKTLLQTIINEKFYTKTETDNLLVKKADTTTTYTKTEIDNLLLNKQNNLTASTNISISNSEISSKPIGTYANDIKILSGIDIEKTYESLNELLSFVDYMSGERGSSYFQLGCQSKTDNNKWIYGYVRKHYNQIKPFYELYLNPLENNNLWFNFNTNFREFTKFYPINLKIIFIKKDDNTYTPINWVGNTYIDYVETDGGSHRKYSGGNAVMYQDSFQNFWYGTKSNGEIYIKQEGLPVRYINNGLDTLKFFINIGCQVGLNAPINPEGFKKNLS